MNTTTIPSSLASTLSRPEMPTIEESQPVTDIAVGVFDNYDGGVLVRFNLAGGQSRLLAFSASQAFDLRDQFHKGIANFEKNGFARGPFQRVLPLPAEDYFHHEPGFEIGQWFLSMGSDGALWRLVPRGAASMVLLLSPSQMASLLFEVECGIENILFIDMRPFNGMRWVELSEILLDHPGFKLAEVLRAFDFSVEIFRRNARALVEHLEKGTGNLSLEQARWDRRFEIDTFVEDAIHLLLNFVASACALVDHSRSFYRLHYEPRNELAHYLAETKRRFANDGLVQFIHKLRTLMLHVGLVGLIHQTTFQRGNIVGRVVMDRDVALAWDNWESVARKWLNDGPREVDLLEVVKAYVAKAEEFQAWYAMERDKIDWRDLRYAEQLRRAVLARRGLEDIPKLNELLQMPPTAIESLRSAVGQFLNAEQLFQLRNHEHAPERWLPKALDMVRDSYFVSLELCDSLVEHFAPGVPLPSTTDRFPRE